MSDGVGDLMIYMADCNKRTAPCPGTLTVTVGNDTVTLNPMDPREKFDRDFCRIADLLASVGGANT